MSRSQSSERWIEKWEQRQLAAEPKLKTKSIVEVSTHRTPERHDQIKQDNRLTAPKPSQNHDPKSSELSTRPKRIDRFRLGGGANQYCTSCGNKRSNEDVFCGRCGVQLNKSAAQDTQ